MAVSTTASPPSARVYYLDWLRVLAMIGVFLFHNARFYDAFSDWHIKNATTNFGATIFVAFMSPWMMPLFFLIAGAGTYYALSNRGAGQFIRERTLRILIPLIFGMLVIVVPQAYYQALFRGELTSGYNLFQIYGLYLTTLPEFNMFHLWFLMYLFVFSIVTVPIFVGGARNVVSRVAAAFDRPWALVLLLVLPLAAADAFLSQDGFWGSRMLSGGWSIVAYVQFFVFGYLIFANERIMIWIKKISWCALVAALVTAGILLAVFLDQLVDPSKWFGSPIYVAAQSVQAMNTWCFLLAILGLGSRFLNRSNSFMTYANEAVLPFYILHQTVIISIGYYVVPTGLPVIVKYPIVALSSFAAIMLIYEVLVRRLGFLRFLFGMRVKRRAEPARAVA